MKIEVVLVHTRKMLIGVKNSKFIIENRKNTGRNMKFDAFWNFRILEAHLSRNQFTQM